MNDLHIGGCKPPTIDLRDYSHKKTFGAGEFPPVSFRVGGFRRIHDQRTTDFCVAYSTTFCSEGQEGVALAPEYIAKKIINPNGFGAEIRAGAKAHVDFGCIEDAECPVKVSENSRAEVLSAKNWNTSHDELAKKHTKLSYFRVDDTFGSKFDSIARALWLHKDDDGI